jgi:hypothetical protein
VLLPWADKIRAVRGTHTAALNAKTKLDAVSLALAELTTRAAVLERLGHAMTEADAEKMETLHEHRADLTQQAAPLRATEQELSQLLAAQHDSLHQPGHEATVAAIKALGRERQVIWDELEPVWQRVKVVEPVVQLIEKHLLVLEGRGSASKVALRTERFICGIQEALSVIHYDIGLPSPPEASWEAIDTVARQLQAVKELLIEERDGLRQRHSQKRAEHDALTAQIQAITG